ncbi:kinase-like domain, phloem protein 2-like protein [Tanacetum coccineum]
MIRYGLIEHISVGAAHAISYIHYDETRDYSVIHQNISSYTVRLNNDFEPKLSEFHHSLKIKASERHNSFHTDSVWSRKGYTDPTCLETNIEGHKSDIYSFGIVLFELLCGRKSVSDDQDNKYLAPKLKGTLIVCTEVEGTSSSQEEGSASHFTSTGVESNSSKKTMSSIKYLSHSQLSFEAIESATNNFAPENIIREKPPVKWVYQGRMLHSGQLIDIVARGIYPKYQKEESKKFRMEKSILSSLNHTNVVSLIGFSNENNIFIIYKKEANGSLDKYLSDQTLTWMQRLKICLGVANALSYIHYDAGRDFSVIHCNIKSSKISSQDDQWETQVSAFELS